MASGQVPSTEATGGAGGTFESRFAALALTRMLLGDRVPGLDGPPARVRLQQAYAGAPLDDVVLDADTPVVGTQTIEYQVKRTFSPIASDTDFVDVVGRCHAEVQADLASLTSGARRFGLATRGTNQVKELDRLTRTARAHDNPTSWLTMLGRASNNDIRRRLDHLRRAVKAAMEDGTTDAEADAAAWQIARHLWVWQVDAEPDTDDIRANLDRLRELTLDATKASDVYSTLVDAAEEWAPSGGSIDEQMVRAKAESRGHALDAEPARRAAFRALEAASQEALDPAGATLGHVLHLPRLELRAQVRATVEANPIVVLGGPAGVGKSVMSKLVASDLVAEGAVAVVLNLTGRTGSLAQLEQELGVSLADALAGAPVGGVRMLVIDGAEQALTDGARLLGAVLSVIPVEGGGAPPWRVVLTARNEAESTLGMLVKDKTGVETSKFQISELNDGEIAKILAEFPNLEPVHRNPRAAALLLRRPFLVEMLVRSVATADLPDDVIGEEDVLSMVVHRLIRLDNGGLPGGGAPLARADIFRTLGEAVVSNTIPVALTGFDAEARSGLASDDLVVEARSRWQFAHDILADYSAAERLLEDDGHTLLDAAPSPRRLLRAVRLRAQRDLADGLADGGLHIAWTTVHVAMSALAKTHGPRWTDVGWEALLHMGAARQATETLLPQLLEDDGDGLLALIDIAWRRARTAEIDDVTGRRRLDVALSGPVVDALAAHADDVPDRLRAAAVRLVLEHLAATPGDPFAQLAETTSVPDAALKWAASDDYGDTLENAFSILGLSAPYLGDPHAEFLIRHARNRPHEIAAAVENPGPSRELAAARPDLLLRLAGIYYLDRELTLGPDGPVIERERGLSFGSAFGDRDGVRDHSVEHRRHLSMVPLGNNQSNPALGPFAVLLDHSPDHGRRLVGQVVDAATQARVAIEAGWSEGAPVELELELELTAWSEPVRFTGPAVTWGWHRRIGTGANPALSALMALRAWAVAQIRDGAPPREVRNTVLSTGSSLGFASVALSALVDQLELINDEIDPYLVHPVVWHLESSRSQQERVGSLTLQVPDAHNLTWSLGAVALNLVLRGTDERRAVLRSLGDQLAERGAAQGEELLSRRWASELDIDRYRVEPHDEGLAVSVDYPQGLVEALQDAGGKAAERSLQIADAVYQALAIRNGTVADGSAAPTLWAEVSTLLEQHAEDPAGSGIFSPCDARCITAAALIVARNSGVDADPDTLNAAVQRLLDAGAFFASLDPPLNADDGTDDGERLPGGSFDDTAADRSAAVALAILRLNPDLAHESRVSRMELDTALLGIATSAADETRGHLVEHIRPGWEIDCGDGTLHQSLLAVAERLIATVGKQWATGSFGPRFADVMMPEPVVESIRAADDMTFDVAGASYGLALASGAVCDCPAGIAARDLVEALVDYDQRVWPTHYARHGYHRTALWRRAVDTVVADRVISGDDAALDAHLTAHEATGEELVGFLGLLAERATDEPSTLRLFEIWPLILDRLLPANRDLDPADGDRDRYPNHRSVAELDAALLLVIPADQPAPEMRSDAWPRWFKAFRGTPHVADRAMTLLGQIGLLFTDTGTTMVLDVLGDDLRRLRDSRMLYAWIERTLTRSVDGPATEQVRHLLDRLAANGDDEALAIQTKLEG